MPEINTLPDLLAEAIEPINVFTLDCDGEVLTVAIATTTDARQLLQSMAQQIRLITSKK